MITRFNREKLAKNLPDAYRKDNSSNNAKILDTEKGASDSLRKAISDIDASLDIDKAYGRTLDLYGEMLGQLRGSATDEQYRVLIKNRIYRNFSGADYNSIVKAICATFGCETSDIMLTETEEPCKVKLTGLPISQLVKSNIDIETAAQIVESLMPAGVELYSVIFSGTFEFSGGTVLVYDEAKGFANDEQTIGGYLGMLAGDASDEEAPDEGAAFSSAVLGAATLGTMVLGTS